MATEADCSIYHQRDLPLQSFPVMEEIRRQGKLCDVTLKVDDHSYSAHRIVLAATIPYFQAMFTHDMVESKQKEITIQGIEPRYLNNHITINKQVLSIEPLLLSSEYQYSPLSGMRGGGGRQQLEGWRQEGSSVGFVKDATPYMFSALESLIKFAYCGKVTMDINNVQSLLVGASFLQLQRVREACCDFLKKRLHPHNVLGVRAFADTLGCFSLVTAANKYVQKYFVDVAKSEEFLNLGFNDVKEIIARDELYVVSEEQVFEAVMDWVKRDVEKREVYLAELLTRVRMPLLTPQYLTDKVATEEFIRSSHKCRDLLDEAKDYHLMPERRPLLQSFRTRPRCCIDIVGMIYAVGGLTKSGDSLSTVEVYDPIVGRWQMAEAMSMLRSRVGVAVMRNRLYAIGGYNGQERLSTVEVFDPEMKLWSKVSSMNCKRSAVGAAALNDRLYVCGGYDGVSSLNTVEYYDPDRNEWVMVTSMSKHRSAAGVTAFDGFIYALGGHDGLSIFDSVERYDPQTGLWVAMVPMLSKRCRLGVATLNNKLYVCGGYDGSTFLRTVEVFDPDSKQWSYVASMNVMRSRVALVSNCGKLFAIGGYDGVSNLSTVEMYNPDTDQWTFVASMCAHEGGVGVGVIPMV